MESKRPWVCWFRKQETASQHQGHGQLIGPSLVSIEKSTYFADKDELSLIVRAVNNHELLLSACEAALAKLETLLARECKPTLAPFPKSGVEYIGIEPGDCAEVKQCRAAIASVKGGG